jgi:hypothetical protein
MRHSSNSWTYPPTESGSRSDSDRSGNQDLWTMPSGGGELTQLSSDPAPDWAPQFSPDGKWIAFSIPYRTADRGNLVHAREAARRDS